MLALRVTDCYSYITGAIKRQTKLKVIIMARATVKNVTIKGVDYVASIASNDENDLRSAYLTPNHVIEADLDHTHQDFYTHINSEIHVCRLVDATDEQMLAMIDEKIADMNSDKIESFF